MTGHVSVSADPDIDSCRPVVLRDDRSVDRKLMSGHRSDPRVEVLEHGASMLRVATAGHGVLGSVTEFPDGASDVVLSRTLVGGDRQFVELNPALTLILRLSHQAGTAVRSVRRPLAKVLADASSMGAAQ